MRGIDGWLNRRARELGERATRDWHDDAPWEDDGIAAHDVIAMLFAEANGLPLPEPEHEEAPVSEGR